MRFPWSTPTGADRSPITAPGSWWPIPCSTWRGAGSACAEFVSLLEETLIDLLAGYNIRGGRRPGAPGVYVAGKKIAAIGLRIKRGCSYHGLSLNVAMDLAPFTRIHPCGYRDMTVTQLRDEGGPDRLGEVADALVTGLVAALGYTEWDDTDRAQ